jgi:hypothetical protein
MSFSHLDFILFIFTLSPLNSLESGYCFAHSEFLVSMFWIIAPMYFSIFL